MSDRIELKYTDRELTTKIIHNIKWWQKAINFLYPFYKTFTILDNIEPNDLVITDQDGYSIKKKSLTFNIEPNTFEIEVESLTSGSVSISNNIVNQYYSSIESI